jgi:hypothetical protein
MRAPSHKRGCSIPIHALWARLNLPARDGTAVVYPIRENGTDNLWLQPLDGALGRQITNFLTDSIGQFQFSPNGKKLGMVRWHNDSDVVLFRDSGPPPQ